MIPKNTNLITHGHKMCKQYGAYIPKRWNQWACLWSVLLIEIEDSYDPSIKHAEHLCFVYCVWITENIYFINVILQNFPMC